VEDMDVDKFLAAACRAGLQPNVGLG